MSCVNDVRLLVLICLFIVCYVLKEDFIVVKVSNGWFFIFFEIIDLSSYRKVNSKFVKVMFFLILFFSFINYLIWWNLIWYLGLKMKRFI